MNNRIVIGLLIFFTLSSCKKILDVDSKRTVAEKNMWNSLEDSRAALMGIYGLTQAALADHNAHWLYGDVRAGEFSSPNRQDLKAIASNHLNASYPSIEALSNWRRWYAAVNSANLFIERIGEVRERDDRYTNNYFLVDVAQARFLRAFAYFNLVRNWGDVPFILQSFDGKFENKEREDKDKILAWIEKEMFEAAQDLPYGYSVEDEQQQGNYYNEDSGRWDGALVRKLSAYAVLAHVAAWQQNYPDVASYTKVVMDNYEKGRMDYISTDFLTATNGFFYNKNSNQLLGFNFDWGHVAAGFTGHLEELTLAEPVVNKKMPDLFLTKDSILSIFNEANDERFSLDTLGNPGPERYFTNFNGKYPIFSKVKNIMGGSSDPTFRIFSSAIVFTRLEDVALLRAEALTVLGERGEAIEFLNAVRMRRGLNEYKEELNGDLLNSVFKERQRELMGEGHRWFDLIRYHRIRGRDKDFVNLIANDGIYWPISRSILSQNSNLQQNQFWK